MPTINDYKKKALNDAGYSGDISTAEWKWLKDICYPYVGTIPDMWRYALRQMGFSGSLIEAQSAMLKGLGYTDFSMNNKWYKYWRDTPLEGTTWWELGSALDLDFANSRGFNSADRDKTTPDSILTYTSPSPKMVYGDDGVLGYAPHNLLTYSQQFDNAAWTASTLRATITANTTTAPDGSITADTLTDTTDAGDHRVLGPAPSVVSGTVYTSSVYIKKGVGATAPDWVQLTFQSSGFSSTAFANFNISAGTLGVVSGTGVSSAIQNVGNGWFRCSITAPATVSTTAGTVIAFTNNTDAVVRLLNYTGVVTSDVAIWGAQLNLGPSALTYVPTTTAARYSLPIDHNPTTFEPLGVLIEEQRTNLLTYSEQFDNAAWTKTAVTITADSTTAPNGTTTADKVVDTVALGTHRISVNNFAINSAARSIYVKAAGINEVRFGCYSYEISTIAFGTVNLTTGSVSSVDSRLSSFEAIDVGNGWWRLQCVCGNGTYNSAHFYLELGTGTYAGDGVSGIYIWGAQLEAGAFPTSYIPTVASQVTRAADQVSILTSAFTYNAAAGTVLVEGSMNGNGTGTAGWWALDAGAVQNGHSLRVLLGSNIIAISRGTTTNQTVIGLSPAVAGVFYETAFAYSSTNDRAISTEGGAVVSGSTDVGTINSATTLRLGFQQVTTTGGYVNGHIKRLTYFPTRKSNAELQELST